MLKLVRLLVRLSHLGSVHAAYERELERHHELAAARKDLYKRGALSAAELRAGKRALSRLRRISTTHVGP